jgi:hypothetical protein
VARQECCCRDQKEGGGCQDPDHFLEFRMPGCCWGDKCSYAGVSETVPIYRGRLISELLHRVAENIR